MTSTTSTRGPTRRTRLHQRQLALPQAIRQCTNGSSPCRRPAAERAGAGERYGELHSWAARLRQAFCEFMTPRVGLVLGLLLSACGSSEKREATKPEAQLLGLEIVGDTTIERYDLNGDGKPDLFKTYVLRGPADQPEKRVQLLARQDLDLDFNESVDVRRHFNEAGVVIREEMDLDFDGQFDAVDHFADGVLFRRDMAFNFEGKPSVVKFYNQNKLSRKERDTTGDGKLDTFEFYENGKLVRIGVDKDGDEKPDVYTEVENT